MRVYVPVTLRRGHFAGARGNLISQMVVPLPIGMADPGRRLRHIAAETTRRKARSRPPLGKLPSRGFAGRMFLKLLDRHRVNVTTADVPGPKTPLFLAGAEVLEVFPLLNLIGRVTLGLGAMSYAGAFDLLAVGDGDACLDIDVFAAGVRDDLVRLEASVCRTPPHAGTGSASGSGSGMRLPVRAVHSRSIDAITTSRSGKARASAVTTR
ncbi:MAG TPA: WS/DGAT domain-containing protein [Candidatus Deferrimicrobium sp.]|nr:WS/DGAT domain-containing protein [Candidatus Deferrimicrobium sp.]